MTPADTAAATPAQVNATGTDRSRFDRPQLAAAFERYAAVLAIVVLSVVFSIGLPSTFARWETLWTLLSTQAVLVIIASGVLFPLVAGEFDLSVGAVAGFSTLMLAKLDGTWGVPLGAALVAVIVMGAFIGFVNGLLVTRFRINSFITTLAVSIILSGLAVWVSNGLVIFHGISTSLTDWGTRTVFGQFPVVAFYWIVVAAVAWYALEVTPTGRHIRVVGANVRAARLIGMPIERLKTSAFVVAGLFASLGGIVYLMQIGSAHPSDGPQFLLPAYAAAFLGSTAIKPGRFNVLGTIVAVFLLAVGITGVQLWGAPDWVEPVFDGSALLIAVGLSVASNRSTAAA